MKISAGQLWRSRRDRNYPPRLVLGVDLDGQMVLFGGGQRVSRVPLHRVWKDWVQVEEGAA